MQNATAPEFILREQISNLSNIIKKDNLIVFPNNLSFDSNKSLPFFQKSVNKFYTLGSIWFFLKNKDLPDYIKLSKKEGFEPVSSMDKKHLIDFFINGNNEVSIYDKNKYIEAYEKEESKKDVIKTLNNNDNTKLDLNEDHDKLMIQYLSTKEVSKLNRNSLIRQHMVKFDYLLSLSRKTFCKDRLTEQLKGNSDAKVKTSFFEELVSEESKIIYKNRIRRNKSNYCCSNTFFVRSWKYM